MPTVNKLLLKYELETYYGYTEEQAKELIESHEKAGTLSALNKMMSDIIEQEQEL